MTVITVRTVMWCSDDCDVMMTVMQWCSDDCHAVMTVMQWWLWCSDGYDAVMTVMQGWLWCSDDCDAVMTVMQWWLWCRFLLLSQTFIRPRCLIDSTYCKYKNIKSQTFQSFNKSFFITKNSYYVHIGDRFVGCIPIRKFLVCSNGDGTVITVMQW